LGRRPRRNRHPVDYLALIAMVTGVGYVLLTSLLMTFYYLYTNRWFSVESRTKRYTVSVTLVKRW
jgi:hypothetical protein